MFCCSIIEYDSTPATTQFPLQDTHVDIMDKRITVAVQDTIQTILEAAEKCVSRNFLGTIHEFSFGYGRNMTHFTSHALLHFASQLGTS